jgi:hypothetical protein
MHAIQCCVPNATLLPTGVERLYPAAPSAAGERVTLHAVERSRVGDTYTYDLDIRDAGGAVVERWEGLRLEAVRRADGSGPWVPALLGPYLVCSAVESLRKTGRVVPEALTLHPDGRNGWVLFRAGRCKIATFATRLRGEPDPLIFAIQTEGDGNESVLRVPARREFRRDQPGGKRLLRELRALAGQVPRDVPA